MFVVILSHICMYLYVHRQSKGTIMGKEVFVEDDMFGIEK